jgi:hypothetical protein
MGEKTVEFETRLSVRDCGQCFQSGIVNGRGLSARDRGSHREVALLAHHSLAGGAHANQLLEAVKSEFNG